MQHLPNHVKSLPVSNGLHLQVLDGMRDLPRCHKHHFAAFIRSPAKLVVWDDHPETVLLRAETLEQMIVRHIWSIIEEEDEDEDDGKPTKRSATPATMSVMDLEPGEAEEPRRTKCTSCMIVAASLCLEISCLGLGWRMLALEVAVDRYYLRLLIALASPFTLFLSLVSIIQPLQYVSSNPLVLLPRHHSEPRPAIWSDKLRHHKLKKLLG